MNFENRYLSADPQVGSPHPTHLTTAQTLYNQIADLPLICPHGHVDPLIFVDSNYRFPSPTELLVTPDHYILRMLYSQGVSLQSLGIATRDGESVEQNQRKVWQLFADHFYLFRGTPTGIWLRDELATVFGVREKLTGGNAQGIYDAIDERLQSPAFTPRALYDRFNIEVLCTTDAATDSLEHHKAIRNSGWHGKVLPTFRPDAVITIDAPDWLDQIDALSDAAGISITDYASFIQAIEQRRTFFKRRGARATDHGAQTAYTERLSDTMANLIFGRALAGKASAEDAQRFTGHMLFEMARMSVEDGLVMQLHVGSLRNHNRPMFQKFGRDIGADIPIRTEFTQALRPLLNAFGNHPNLSLILFTLDETAYARELAPLAGHYPAVKLGPPWWFHDSLNGMRRYFDQVMETAGLYNTVGFNDDTRAYPSIAVRHDVWRRASADWVAGLLLRGIVDEEDAHAMMRDLAYNLAKEGYRL